jgi:hypothetical protein
MTEGSGRDIIYVVCDCCRQRTGTKCPRRENLSLIQQEACGVTRGGARGACVRGMRFKDESLFKEGNNCYSCYSI